jgi:hypothetical protein
MDGPISFFVSLTENTVSILFGTKVVLLPYTFFFIYIAILYYNSMLHYIYVTLRA